VFLKLNGTLILMKWLLLPLLAALSWYYYDNTLLKEQNENLVNLVKDVEDELKIALSVKPKCPKVDCPKQECQCDRLECPEYECPDCSLYHDSCYYEDN
jgi:hypothetical protein